MGISDLHGPVFYHFGQEILIGGYVGSLLARLATAGLHSLGAHILFIGLFLIGLVLATPFSLVSSWNWMKQLSWSVWGLLTRLLSQIQQAIQPNKKTKDEKVVIQRFEKVKNDLPEVELLPAPAAPSRSSNKQVQNKRISASQPTLVLEQYFLPSLEILDTYEKENRKPDRKVFEEKARILEKKLADFGVQGKVVDICPGPVVTMYEYVPAPGIKISRVVSLADDLSMALRAISIRIVAPIPGKAAIGIEIPNQQREPVSIKTILESVAFTSSSNSLTIALGKDIMGQPVVANLARMPHLLIAGATGTGKSVGINSILTSLLYRNTPDAVRLLLIDPKRIELSSYEGIPHLLHPVVTDAKLATRALHWAVKEMELRYKLLADKNVRNIEGYNKALAREKPADQSTQGSMLEDCPLEHHYLPYIVVIIDELADLMMVASREVEESITRLAQMARAAGIHLILATQRPSVDVLTGVIKANIPTRISFQVSSRVDSRTILDTMGAETLLGAGDMLFLPPGTAKLQRIHGAFISEKEVQRVTQFWQEQQISEDTLANRVDFQDSSSSQEISEDELDAKYDEAVQLVMEMRQASISMLQRRLRVGYNRAARMIEIMEQQGIVGPSDGTSKPREVLVSSRTS
jgi:S-DNA-T family DNA segregation ATPase FtsK/SpoIIIE